MLTELEQRIVAVVQAGFPLVREPFREMATQLGLTEEALLEHLRRLQAQGVLRSLRAILAHRRVGYAANAMVVWRVPAARVAEVGRVLAAFPEVSHCYERAVANNWPYNLYTMLHGRSREACLQVAARMAAAVALTDYELLFSTAELKKTGMTYFTQTTWKEEATEDGVFIARV